MSEIPEDLLKRSREAKAAKLGTPLPQEQPTGTSQPSNTTAVAAATPAAPLTPAEPSPDLPYLDSPPKPPKPEPLYVKLAKQRKKIPIWAMPVVAVLPIWAWGFAGTMQQPETEDPLFIEAAALYEEKGCSSCHGAAGAGGTGYAFTEGAVLETFPNPIDQMIHVARGSSEISGQEYGAVRSDGTRRVSGTKGNMPAQIDSLTQLELEMLIFHERAVLSGEDTTKPEYEEWMEHLREAYEAADKTPIDLDGLLACTSPDITPGATADAEKDACPGPHSEEEV